MTYPLQPTERDHERFRDACKCHLTFCDFDRHGIDGDYKSQATIDLFRLWWSVEKERQLLQSLNLSQSAEIQRLLNLLNGDEK